MCFFSLPYSQFMLQWKMYAVSYDVTWHAPPEKCNYTLGRISPHLLWLACSLHPITSCSTEFIHEMITIIKNNNHSVNIRTHKCQQIPGGNLLKLPKWMWANVQSREKNLRQTYIRKKKNEKRGARTNKKVPAVFKKKKIVWHDVTVINK